MKGKYILYINILTFILFGVDKLKAIKNRRRIANSTLILAIFLGGAIGGLLGMVLFKHKIRKYYYLLSIGVSLIISSIAIYYLKIIVIINLNHMMVVIV